MTKLEAIEQLIAELDPEGRAKLLVWLSEQSAGIDGGGGGVEGRLQLLRDLKGAGAPRTAVDIDGLIRHIRSDN